MAVAVNSKSLLTLKKHKGNPQKVTLQAYLKGFILATA